MSDYTCPPMSKLEIYQREIAAAKKLLRDVLAMPESPKRDKLEQAARQALHKAQDRLQRHLDGE
jgi:hypothetical protein